jgi:HD-GYP domain-containing protein (c-di-GMP phosphodiesterase class II)
MIASNRFAGYAPQVDAEKSALARVPERTFADSAWVTLALKSCMQYLSPAIRSGKPHRIANAVRAIAHAPTAEQVGDVIGAACDSMLAEAYAVRDVRLISNVASARSVIGTVIADLHERSERQGVAPTLLRETVTAYVQIVALLNNRLAERLDAVGILAARIASAMGLPASALLEIELAGRLHDIGTLTVPGTTCTDYPIEDHPSIGASLIESVPSLAHLATIVRSHHEHFSGGGYPEGLIGAEIPLAARVISVAATFVDLVTGSPAREAMLPNAACHEIALRSGSEFDPDVVTATLHLLRYRQRTHRSA